MKFLTYDPAKGKNVLIGNIINGVLIKEVNPAIHYMKVVDGYGIQYSAFVQLGIKGVKRIKIIEQGGKQWEASVKVWQKHSKIMDYGNGKQVFLSLKFMKQLNPKQNPAKEQINLFGAMSQLAGTSEWENLRKVFHPEKSSLERE